jgi:hypothetical protein
MHGSTPFTDIKALGLEGSLDNQPMKGLPGEVKDRFETCHLLEG